ncbi:unnamed protein product [Discosporangium mesarthrocarpum]
MDVAMSGLNTPGSMLLTDVNIPDDLAAIPDDDLLFGEDMLGFNLEDDVAIIGQMENMDNGYSLYPTDGPYPRGTTANPDLLKNGQPIGYKSPGFFPFAGSVPSSVKLKTASFSTLKKINSGLLKSGNLNEKEEADTVRELERALSVLTQQKRFLEEQRDAVEQWASSVYQGQVLSSLKRQRVPAHGPLDDAKIDAKESSGPRKDSITEIPNAKVAEKEEIRVKIKCKGVDKRRIDRPLLALVDKAMWNARGGPGPTTAIGLKREATPVQCVKPSKKSKVHTIKPESAAAVIQAPHAPPGEDVVGMVQTGEDLEAASAPPSEAHDAALPDTPATSRDLWAWLESSSYLKTFGCKEPLPHDLTLQAEGRVSQYPRPVTVRAPGQTHTIEKNEAWVSCRKITGDTDLMQQQAEADMYEGGMLTKRLLSALIVPRSGGGRTGSGTPVRDKDKSSSPAKKLKDVQDCSQDKGCPGVFDQSEDKGVWVGSLNLEQRVSIQLKAVGLLGDEVYYSSKGVAGAAQEQALELHHLQAHLAKTTHDLNRHRLVVRENMLREHSLSEAELRRRHEKEKLLLKGWEELLEKNKARRSKKEEEDRAERARLAQMRNMPW